MINSYERVFMQSSSKALEEAINYIFKKGRAKTLGEVAKKTHVSNSTLTAYMNGSKEISKHFREKFNLAFKLDLNNPLTFEDADWLEELITQELPPIAPGLFLKTYNTLRKLLMSQQQVIEGLRTTIDGLRGINRELHDTFLRNEEALITGTIKGKTFI